jgi:hypothetical protein
VTKKRPPAGSNRSQKWSVQSSWREALRAIVSAEPASKLRGKLPGDFRNRACMGEILNAPRRASEKKSAPIFRARFHRCKSHSFRFTIAVDETTSDSAA